MLSLVCSRSHGQPFSPRRRAMISTNSVNNSPADSATMLALLGTGHVYSRRILQEFPGAFQFGFCAPAQKPGSTIRAKGGLGKRKSRAFPPLASEGSPDLRR